VLIQDDDDIIQCLTQKTVVDTSGSFAIDVLRIPEELERLSAETRVEGISDVDIDAVDIRQSGIHVRGRGMVEVELNYGGGVDRDGVSSSDAFPFYFDAQFAPDLSLVQVSRNVDTSDFHAEKG